MRKCAIAGLALAVAATLTAGASALRAEEVPTGAVVDVPEMPAPQKEHEWLQRFVGEWESTTEATPAPGQPAFECRGSETVRAVGGFWILAEGRSEVAGGPRFSHVLTLGYDAAKGKYVGTWIDSMTGHLWQYEGAVDPTGQVLTLYSEGPSCLDGGKPAKFKEVTEFKSDDHRVFTSAVQGEDGQWTTIVTSHSRRKK